MKKDTIFNPDVCSSGMPAGLVFRVAEERDLEGVVSLMYERNPTQDRTAIVRQTEREIALNVSDPKYWLFVADLDGQVVGFARCYHSTGLPPGKARFPSPEGWYWMGLMVDSSLRRRSVGRFLYENLTRDLKGRGAYEVYSMVDVENAASVRMHERFGFEEVERGHGFLNIDFAGSSGILYRRAL